MGLLAYALYKRSIHENRAAGKVVPASGSRDPSEAEKKAYRSLAQQMLDVFGESAEKSAKDSLLDGGLRPDLHGLRDDLVKHIDRRTSWTSAFLVNLVAWIASIGITVLLAVGVSAPSWIPRLRRAFGYE